MAGHKWKQIGSGRDGYVVEACDNCETVRSRSHHRPDEYQHRFKAEDGSHEWTEPSAVEPKCNEVQEIQ